MKYHTKRMLRAILSTQRRCVIPAYFPSLAPTRLSFSTLVRPIVYYPNDILKTRCEEIVDTSSESTQKLIADLKYRAVEHNALGLAAPQIGELKRMFVMRTPLANNKKELKRTSSAKRAGFLDMSISYRVCINPEIIYKSPYTKIGVEGCISITNVYSLVRRNTAIKVQFTNEQGELEKLELNDLPAVVFQHELDHLDGVLQTDRELKSILQGSMEDIFSAAEQEMFYDLYRYYGESSHLADAV